MTKKFITAMIALTVFGCFVILALGGTHDPWDGTKWDITSPDIDQPHGNVYKELYDLRKGVAIRMNKEHTTLGTSSAGGIHKNGAAIAYEGTSTPTNRPDGSTALADNAYDRGRVWLDDNFNPPLLKRWDGTAVEIVGTLSGGADPCCYMHNTSQEDTERGRQSQFRTYGEQSGGEKSTLGYIEISHDGTADDEKGRILFALNDGNDVNAPSKIAMVFQSDGAIDVGDSLSVLDEDVMTSDSATKLATQQSIKAYVDSNTTDITETDVSGVSWFLDEDNMASNDATKVASQQSIKAYIATQIKFSAYTTEDSESTTLVKSHAYLAATSGFVCARESDLDAGEMLRGWVDTDNDPPTGGDLVAIQKSLGADGNASIFFAVRAGEYFEVTSTGTLCVIFWKSIGPLSKPVDQD